MEPTTTLFAEAAPQLPLPVWVIWGGVVGMCSGMLIIAACWDRLMRPYGRKSDLDLALEKFHKELAVLQTQTANIASRMDRVDERVHELEHSEAVELRAALDQAKAEKTGLLIERLNEQRRRKD